MIVVALIWLTFLSALSAQITEGTIKTIQKISGTEGNFTGLLDDSDRFGISVARLGDLDGDAVPDLVVGAYTDDDGGLDRGAVYILFMNVNGTVRSHQKISATTGNFTGMLDNSDLFGISVAVLGDLDGDSVPDLAVGAFEDDDGGTGRGAMYILFMNANGTVKSHQKISDTEGNFTGMLDNSDLFGISVAVLGDLDGDSVPELVVGAYRDDDGGLDRGAVYILFMNANGTVKSHQKISDTAGDFTAVLDNSDNFGISVAGLRDLDGDSVPDLAVGAFEDDDGGTGRGAMYILFMNANGTVKSHQKISSTTGNFSAILDDFDNFGRSVARLGDLDGDAVPDLVVGAHKDDDGGTNRGAIYFLFMNANGTVKSHRKISATSGNFNLSLDEFAVFGNSVTGLEDLDNDSLPEIAVGAQNDNDGGAGRGAVYVVFLQTDPSPPSNLTAITSDEQIDLHWSPNTEADFLRYRIYGGTASGPTAVVDSTAGGDLNDTTATITGLTNGTTYYYRLTAVDTAGNESSYSNEVLAMPYGGPLWHIATTGSDSGGNGSVDLPFATVQHGIDQAAAGDTILISPGTYFESLQITTGNLTVASNFAISGDTLAISATIIDAQPLFSRVIQVTADSIQILGLTIANGYVDGKGAGININGISPYIDHCIFIGNSTSTNSNNWGGAIYLTQGTIENSQFQDNFAREGGAIATRGDTTFIRACIFKENNSNYECDDVMLIGLGTVLYIDESTFMNSPNNSIREQQEANLFISSSVFDSCARAILMGQGDLEVRGSQFRNCGNPTSQGGAIWTGEGKVTISNTIFDNNQSEFGGAIWVKNSATLNFNIFINNSAPTGGAIYGNPSSDSLRINNCSFYNTGGPDNKAVHYEGTLCWINNTILYGSTVGGWLDNYIITYSNYIDWTGLGHGNISSDPLFVDPANGDLSLSWNSPAIDAGDPLSSLDPDGTKADIGAYYFDQRDSEAPVISIQGAIPNTVFTQDTLVVSWSATDNVSVSSVNILLFHEAAVLDTISVGADPTQPYSLMVPDRLSASTRIIVTAVDWKDNTASDTSASFVIADDIPPTVLSIGSDSGFVVPEYEQLAISAIAQDNIAVDSIWAMFDNGITARLLITGTFNDTSYVGAVTIPSGVTDSAIVIVFARDASGNIDSLRSEYITVRDNTPPVIASLDAAPSLDIGSQATLSWSAEDNVGVSANDLAYQITGAGTWQTIGTGIADSSYLWTIPNDPTDNLNLRLIAWDAVGLSDTLYSQGHEIVIAYPKLVTAPNPINPIFWRSPFLTFGFDQILDTTLNAGSAFQVSALFTTNLQMGAAYSEDLRSITMRFEQPLVSSDTVTISLIADSIANLYGYQFDGNANGVPEGSPTDDITYTYTVLPYADFDSSQTIDFDDLTRFTTAWYAKDYALELGPSSGTVPYLLMAPDTTFNGRDLITFIRMWDWYTVFAAPLGKVIAEHPVAQPTITLSDDRLNSNLDVGQQMTAVHIQIEFPKDRAKINILSSDSSMFGLRFVRTWPEQGIIEVDYALPKESLPEINLSSHLVIEGRDPVTINVYTEALGKDGARLGGTVTTFEARPIPHEFGLHNNYPNPFNPSTTILFDIPTATKASLIVYDLRGREVIRLVDRVLEPGYHQVVWDGREITGRQIASGIYFARLSTSNYSKSVKMLLLK